MTAHVSSILLELKERCPDCVRILAFLEGRAASLTAVKKVCKSERPYAMEMLIDSGYVELKGNTYELTGIGEPLAKGAKTLPECSDIKNPSEVLGTYIFKK